MMGKTYRYDAEHHYDDDYGDYGSVKRRKSKKHKNKGGKAKFARVDKREARWKDLERFEEAAE